jgi:YjbE family integral membrane protein
MDITSALHLLGTGLQVFLLDLCLSGDNAVVIALACRRLARAQQRQLLMAGTGIAVVLRVVLALLASLVLLLPALKLVGGIALAVIAVRLMLDEGDGMQAQDGDADAQTNFGAALRTVVIADVVMSMDNIMALAGIANDHAGALALGVAFSVPLLMFGSWLVTRVLADYPLLVPLGGALLGWVAGSIAMADPLLSSWVDSQSPLLHVVVPVLTAAYVLLQARVVRERGAEAAKLRPRSRPLTVLAPQPAVAAAVVMPVGAVAAALPAATVRAPVAVAPASPPAPAPAPAPTRASSAAPQRRTAQPFLAIGGAFAVAAVLAGMIYVARLPAPQPLKQYACAGSSLAIAYTAGGPRIRATSGTATVEGIVDAGNRIAWTPSTVAAASLDMPLPDKVRFADATTLGLGGTGIPDINCRLR